MATIKNGLFIVTVSIAICMSGCRVVANSTANLDYFFASQSGHKTLDQGEGGGNPFASALVELLEQKKLDFETFGVKIVELTSQKSQGIQQPEIVIHASSDWQIIPPLINEERIALVLVYSDYKTSGVNSLPGAKNDMLRITKALRNIGFKVQRVLDPDNDMLHQTIESFAIRSKQADVALLYTTGHGVEVDGITYLLPGDYPVQENRLALDRKGIKLSWLGSALHAQQRNLLFYGGCRDNPFANQINK